MTEARPVKPIPQPDPMTQPYWDATMESRLAIQRCSDCGYFNHPPKPLCDKCSSQELSFQPVSGRGRVYSYTRMHQRNVTGFQDDIPYVNLLVELEEQPKLFMISYLPGSEVEKVTIGQQVEVFFEPIAEGLMLPQFRLLGGE